MAEANEIEKPAEEVAEEPTETPSEVPAEEDQDKPKFSKEDQLKYYEGRAARLRKDLGLDKTETPAPSKREEDKSGLGLDEKAYLRASGITPKEFDFVQQMLQETGKPLEALIDHPYFQAELKLHREYSASREAIPTGGKRASQSAKDTVDFWLQKGELPKDRELRTKVVNERIKREKSRNNFSDQSVV